MECKGEVHMHVCTRLTRLHRTSHVVAVASEGYIGKVMWLFLAVRITPFGIRLSSWTRGADSVSERHGAMSRGSTYACVRQLQKAT